MSAPFLLRQSSFFRKVSSERGLYFSWSPSRGISKTPGRSPHSYLSFSFLIFYIGADTSSCTELKLTAAGSLSFLRDSFFYWGGVLGKGFFCGDQLFFFSAILAASLCGRFPQRLLFSGSPSARTNKQVLRRHCFILFSLPLSFNPSRYFFAIASCPLGRASQ